MDKKFELHGLLKLINIDEYPKERVEQLWTKLQEQDYAFDDTLKGDVNVFLSQFILPNNLFFEIGDLQGLVCVTGIQPDVACSIHFLTWDKLGVGILRSAGISLIENLFGSYNLHRISAFIPQMNKSAQRLAGLLGFRAEGILNEAFLHNGMFENIVIMGLLQPAFDAIKEF